MTFSSRSLKALYQNLKIDKKEMKLTALNYHAHVMIISTCIFPSFNPEIIFPFNQSLESEYIYLFIFNIECNYRV